jgi:hypothetical protein
LEELIFKGKTSELLNARGLTKREERLFEIEQKETKLLSGSQAAGDHSARSFGSA